MEEYGDVNERREKCFEAFVVSLFCGEGSGGSVSCGLTTDRWQIPFLRRSNIRASTDSKNGSESEIKYIWCSIVMSWPICEKNV